MTSEEKYLREKMGTKNPFLVSEGYFNTLSTRVIAKVNETEPTGKTTARVYHLRLLASVAACLLLAVVSSVVYIHFSSEDVHRSAVSQTEFRNADAFDNVVEYAMVDNCDIYACLMND